MKTKDTREGKGIVPKRGTEGLCELAVAGRGQGRKETLGCVQCARCEMQEM